MLSWHRFYKDPSNKILLNVKLMIVVQSQVHAYSIMDGQGIFHKTNYFLGAVMMQLLV